MILLITGEERFLPVPPAGFSLLYSRVLAHDISWSVTPIRTELAVKQQPPVQGSRARDALPCAADKGRADSLPIHGGLDIALKRALAGQCLGSRLHYNAPLSMQLLKCPCHGSGPEGDSG